MSQPQTLWIADLDINSDLRALARDVARKGEQDAQREALLECLRGWCDHWLWILRNESGVDPTTGEVL